MGSELCGLFHMALFIYIIQQRISSLAFANSLLGNILPPRIMNATDHYQTLIPICFNHCGSVLVDRVYTEEKGGYTNGQHFFS